MKIQKMKLAFIIFTILITMLSCQLPINISFPTIEEATPTNPPIFIPPTQVPTQAVIPTSQIVFHTPLPAPTQVIRITPTTALPDSKETENITTVSAKEGWQNSKIWISSKVEVRIKVKTGSWTHGSAPYNNGIGNPGYICGIMINPKSCVEPLPMAPQGSLIGKIGNQIFAIGSEIKFIPQESGDLYLRINDGDVGLYDNNGFLEISVYSLQSSFQDDFSAEPLNSRWNWVDPLRSSNYSLVKNKGFLRIETPNGNHDLYPQTNMNSPRLVQPVNGDFEIQTKVLTAPKYTYQSAGLCVLIDSQNVVWIGRSNDNVIGHGYYRNGTNAAPAQPNFSSTEVFLRITRIGNKITTYHSTDGQSWEDNGSITFPNLPLTIQAGIFVINNWQNNAFYADFDYVNIN